MTRNRHPEYPLKDIVFESAPLPAGAGHSWVKGTAGKDRENITSAVSYVRPGGREARGPGSSPSCPLPVTLPSATRPSFLRVRDTLGHLLFPMSPWNRPVKLGGRNRCPFHSWGSQETSKGQVSKGFNLKSFLISFSNHPASGGWGNHR